MNQESEQSETRPEVPPEEVSEPPDSGGQAAKAAPLEGLKVVVSAPKPWYRRRRGITYLSLLAVLVLGALVGAAMSVFRPRPIKLPLVMIDHCEFCRKAIEQADDTLVAAGATLSALGNAVTDNEIEHHTVLGPVMAAQDLAELMLDAIKLKRLPVVISSYDGCCDSCGNATVSVDTGTVYYCRACDSIYRRNTKSISMRRSDIPPEPVRKKTGLCGAPACQLKDKHPSWGLAECRLIVDHQVWLGMTSEQAVAARGKPRNVKRTADKPATREQWVYNDQGSCLHFEDGKLTSW